jgi:Rrf2 family protein
MTGLLFRNRPLHPLSQSAGYAILAMSCLADPGGAPIMIHEVAGRIKAPKPYLYKVFNALTKAGLVSSRRARQGGVILVRPAREVTLNQIAVAMDGERWRTSCLMGLSACSDGVPCPVHSFWTAERKRIFHELQSATLADVARFERTLPDLEGPLVPAFEVPSLALA